MDWRIHLFRGYLEVKRKRSRVYNSLKNTLTDSRSIMSLSSCLLFTLVSNTWTCTHTRSERNKEDDDLQLLISPFTTAIKIAGIYWVIFSCFSSISSPFFVFFILSLSNWDYKSDCPNRKLNLIKWWICFSFQKVDRWRAIIHVFTETPPTQRSRKVVWVMQN